MRDERKHFSVRGATVTIRFSKARHVRREPDEVRQQVEGSIDGKKRQAGLATLVEVFPLSRLLLHPIAS